MNSQPHSLSCLLALFLVGGPMMAASEDGPKKYPRKDEILVEVRDACPGIVVELRYETARNAAGYPIYPVAARSLVRKSVASRLLFAQQLLAKHRLKLKVWDAYRPPAAQVALWKARPNAEFVGDPAKGGSLHAWGVAVDVTLVDEFGRDLRMPTDFDEIGPTAARRYRGKDADIAHNLALLQDAMTKAGFLAMRDEWWHFASADYLLFGPVEPPVSIDPMAP